MIGWPRHAVMIMTKGPGMLRRAAEGPAHRRQGPGPERVGPFVGPALLATLPALLAVLVGCGTASAPAQNPARTTTTGAAASGSAGPRSTSSPTVGTAARSTRCTPTGADSAQAAVTGFLDAINRHDVAGVCRLFAPELRAEYETTTPRFDEWVADQVSATLRSPLGQMPDGGDTNPKRASYRDLQIIAATYDVRMRTESALETSGPRTRFFIVGRAGANGPWLILSIGTGP